MDRDVTASTARSAFLLMAGRTVGFALSFGIPLVLVRHLDQGEFGTYKQLFLIYGTVYGIAQFGMAESLFYFLPTAPRDAGCHVFNAVAALGVAGLVCGTLLAAAGPALARSLDNEELTTYLPLLALYLGLMLTSGALEIVMTARKQYLRAAISYASSDLVRAVLFTLPVLALGELRWVFVGAAAFAALRVVVALAYLGAHFGGTLRPHFGLWKRQIAYAAPFALAVLVEVVQANFHQYAVSAHFPAAVFAIYAVGCLQVPVVDFLALSAANVMMVRMAEDLREGRAHAVVSLWHETTARLALLLFPLVGLLLLTAYEVIVLLFTEQYAASVPIFMISCTAMALSAFTVDGVMRVYAQTRYLVVLNTVRLAVIVGLIGWCLSTFGLPGAILVTVVATLLTKTLGIARARHLMRVGWADALPWRDLGGILAATMAAAIVALAVKSLLDVSLVPRLVVTSLAYSLTYLGLAPGVTWPALKVVRVEADTTAL